MKAAWKSAASAWASGASVMTGEPGQVFLLHLTPPLPLEPPARLPQALVPGTPQPVPPLGPALAGLLDRLPDGFVLASGQGIVLRANPAFLDLVQAAAPAVVLGESLGRWLQHTGTSLDVLLANLARHGVVRLFRTTLTGELGSTGEVEISAASAGAAGGDQAMICLVLRDISRRLDPVAAPQDLRAVLHGLTAGLGDNSLPELIRMTTDIVERHCIENALQRCNGNRRATADMLGLSRQSLYGKLKRHGVDRGGEDNE